MAEDCIHHQNISGVSAQNYSQVFAGSAQNVYFANPQSSQEPSGKAVIECRNALYLTDPRIDRESLITAKGTRVPGTCEWIKDDATYRAWLTCGGNNNSKNHSNSRMLWISGGPGKGKTMLSIFLTEELERHKVHTENSELLFFFCSAQDEKRNTATAVLRGLLHQITAKRPQLIKHALPYFEPPERVPQTLSSLEALWIIFSAMVSDIEFGTMFCVLDGLDECEETTRRALVSRLAGLLKEPVPSNKNWLKIAIISRDIPGLHNCPRIRLDPDNDESVASDIGQFVSARVKELSQIKGFNDDPQKSVYVQRELLTRSEGTFLWVGFAMDELLQKRTWTEVLCSLQELPSGLPAIYSRMLLGIPNEHRDMSRLILRWVTLAVRPLGLEELAAAACIQSSSSSQAIKRQATLDAISHCGPLIQVQEDTISFIHQSARDYLLREKQDDSEILEDFRIEPKKAHLELLQTCIKCINQSSLQRSADVLDYPSPLVGFNFVLTSVDRGGKNMKAPSQESSLLAYAVLHWPEHAKGCSTQDVALSDILKPFFHENSIVLRNWWIAYNHMKRTFWPPDLPLVHMQCYLGLVPLVEEVVASEKWKPRFLKRINKKDAYGDTALHLAVKGGNRDLVPILINGGARVNARGYKNETPLNFAAEAGDVEALQLLLNNGADMNVKKYFTMLSRAAIRGNEAIVRVLLDNGADVNAEDKDNGTALLHAARGGHVEVVRLLLDKGADVNAKNKNQRTALHCAVLYSWIDSRKRMAAAQLLISRGVDMNARDSEGRTALQIATEQGYEEMVQLLKENVHKLEGGCMDGDSS